jgi:predicted kinase
VGTETAELPVHGGKAQVIVPDAALVLLIGASGSGKSTFAARHFAADAVVSSDQLRGLITGDEGDQQASAAAFGRLHRWLDAQLASGVLAVVDATNTDWTRRAELLGHARRYGRATIAIAFDLPLDLCLQRNAARPRRVPAAVIRRQHDELRRDLERLDLEGFSAIHVLRTEADVERATVEIEKGPVARAPSS